MSKVCGSRAPRKNTVEHPVQGATGTAPVSPLDSGKHSLVRRRACSIDLNRHASNASVQ